MRRSHPEVESRLSEVEEKNNEACMKIIQLMVYRYVDSFETIIVDTIRARCPSLKKIDDEQKLVEGDNKNEYYVDHLVFDLIFKGVDDDLLNPIKEAEFKITHIIDGAKKNAQTPYYKLEHKGVCLARANQEQTLSDLKQTILKLISDNRVKERVDQYYRTFNAQEGKMHDVKQLSDQWYAGNLEQDENYPVCAGCPPRPDVVER